MGPLIFFFSDLGKFDAVCANTFLRASLLVLIVGAGFFSVDTLPETRFTPEKA